MDDRYYPTEDEWACIVDAGSILIAADQAQHDVTVGVERAGQAVRLTIGQGLATYYGIVRPDGTATVRREDTLPG